MADVTIRELRNHGGDVVDRAARGEQITITRNGETFAKLLPATPDKLRKVDWAAHLKKHKPVGKGMSKEATEKLWSDLRD